jgi:poly-beta-1,6-N-acetyl-D-glucosamine synthase
VAGVEPSNPIHLVGGVVAFNEERRLGPAVESLLAQELPPGAHWRAIWVVASGCTDRTDEVAQALAARHPEVRVLIQSERRGKAAALGEIFREARGDYLVLLNADATARPGAVSALLRSTSTLVPPYAVMGHPQPAELPPAGRGSGIQLLWNLHHRLHVELLTSGEGTHLSDELLLLPLSHLPPLPEEIVNDGAFIGAWLKSRGGQLVYAVDARVSIEVPGNMADHVRQRRRIHVGHQQVMAIVGVSPTTMGRYLTRRPGRALTLVASEVRNMAGGAAALAWLVVGEVVSVVAACWDRVPPRRSHRLWTPIRGSADSPGPFDRPVARTSTSTVSSDRAG